MKTFREPTPYRPSDIGKVVHSLRWLGYALILEVQGTYAVEQVLDGAGGIRRHCPWFVPGDRLMSLQEYLEEVDSLQALKDAA